MLICRCTQASHNCGASLIWNMCNCCAWLLQHRSGISTAIIVLQTCSAVNKKVDVNCFGIHWSHSNLISPSTVHILYHHCNHCSSISHINIIYSPVQNIHVVDSTQSRTAMAQCTASTRLFAYVVACVHANWEQHEGCGDFIIASSVGKCPECYETHLLNIH